MAKILVIDDDPGFRRMILMILTRMHHDVVEAQDGNEGVENFKAEQPDLVISDIVMPDKEGIQTILEIRAMAPDAKIIAMSGGGVSLGTGYLSAAQKLGANLVLSKPFRPTELTAMVEQLLPNDTAS
jgi:two-component system, chemotaxis family, chemotaxis protein CheY